LEINRTIDVLMHVIYKKFKEVKLSFMSLPDKDTRSVPFKSGREKTKVQLYYE